MTDTSLARVLEAQRIIGDAIADVPLTCSAPEAAAALQSLGCKMAERCMSPIAIARNLLRQAEAYIAAAPRHEPETISERAVVDRGHAAITACVGHLEAAGIPVPAIQEMLLGFTLAWIGRSGAAESAALLYRHADALAGKVETAH